MVLKVMPVFLPGSEGSACTSDLVLPLYFLTGSESSLSVFLPGSKILPTYSDLDLKVLPTYSWPDSECFVYLFLA